MNATDEVFKKVINGTEVSVECKDNDINMTITLSFTDKYGYDRSITRDGYERCHETKKVEDVINNLYQLMIEEMKDEHERVLGALDNLPFNLIKEA